MRRISIFQVTFHILTLMSFVYFSCIKESGFSSFILKNNTSNQIKMTYSYDGTTNTEHTHEVAPAKVVGGGSASFKVKHISDFITYLIIRDDNNNEIMNISGQALDSVFKVIKETEDSIEFRLDVN